MSLTVRSICLYGTDEARRLVLPERSRQTARIRSGPAAFRRLRMCEAHSGLAGRVGIHRPCGKSKPAEIIKKSGSARSLKRGSFGRCLACVFVCQGLLYKGAVVVDRNGAPSMAERTGVVKIGFALYRLPEGGRALRKHKGVFPVDVGKNVGTA